MGLLRYPRDPPPSAKSQHREEEFKQQLYHPSGEISFFFFLFKMVISVWGVCPQEELAVGLRRAAKLLMPHRASPNNTEDGSVPRV